MPFAVGAVARQQGAVSIKRVDSLLALAVANDTSQSQSNFELVNQAIRISKDSNNSYELAFCYLALGELYANKPADTNRLKYNLMALKTGEDGGYTDVQEKALGRIGADYIYLRDETKALEFSLRALQLNLISNNLKSRINIFSALGVVYRIKGKPADALKYLNEALKTALEIRDTNDIFCSYSNLAEHYSTQADYSHAIEYDRQTLVWAYRTRSLNSIAMSNIDLANGIYKAGSEALVRNNIRPSGKNIIAEQYFKEAEKYAKESGRPSIRRYAYGEMSNFYQKMGKWELAFRYYKKAISARDEVVSVEKTQATGNLQLKYETEKRDLAIQSLHKDKIIAAGEISNQKLIRNLFVIGFILVILLVFFLINRAKLKRSIEMERMRNRLSRDLHDDIGSTLSSINILSRTAQSHLQHAGDDRTKSSLEKISDRSQRLLDNMSDIIWNIKPGNDTIEEVMSRMREYATTVLEAKNINYMFNFPKEKMDCKLTMAMKNNLYLIFKEAVNNLSKYSGATNALLSLTFTEKQMRLAIEDNGKGFDMEQLSHKGGLLNMRQRAEDIKGTIDIVAAPGKGVSIVVVMPRYCR